MAQQIQIRDVDDLKKFHDTLKRHNQDLDDLRKRMDASCRTLGESWRDQEYQRFLEEWQVSMRAMQQFLERSDGFVKHVRAKEQRARDFLRAR